MTTVASLQNLDTLHGHRVMFRNKDEYFRKISVMQMDGAEKLNIVSDFDFTMTQFWLNGKRGASCHKVIEDCGLLTEDYHRNAQAVQLKYYPLEVDPTLDAVTRTNYMIEWVFEAHKLLCKSGLTKEKIQTAVTNSIANQGVALRDKVASFFSLLNEFNVPFLIFSAGIADVLEEILRQYVGELNHELVHVISNRCEFHGPNHTLSEMLEPCLHVFNKKSSAFLDTPYFQRPDLPNRTNLLLIGDSLGDVTMCEGMNYNPETIIKIGFLNDRLERLEQYLEIFDVVVFNDPDFQIPLSIVRDICEEEGIDHSTTVSMKA